MTECSSTTSSRSRWTALAGLLLGCALSGCGEPAPVSIEGRVKLDGRPLDEAAIQFVPEAAGRRTTGCVVENGAYRLPAENGLLPGDYRVDVLDLPPLAHSSEPRRPFPHRYSKNSPLAVSIEPGGPRQFDFELRSSE